MLNIHEQSTQATASTKPRHILEEIVEHKQQEVALMKEQLPIDELKLQINLAPPVRNFLNAIRQNSTPPSIIAEVKKASPSKGVIRADFEPVKIAQAYERGGATCISVLTDEKFFQGGFKNLRLIRNNVELPLLCKEFVIDPYQIYLARVNGADAVLLIAAILNDETLQDFLNIIQHLGMTPLVEVHTLTELDRVLALSNVQLVGINNRNLENFTLDIEITKHLLVERQQKLSDLDITIVSESGLYTSSDLAFVSQAGAKAVLVGESLVKQADLEQAVKELRM
ncbi:MAG: indole-3-glycerol phosphate synthase TrpC [Brasilonema octagenarum HA4186-MV1]|jgi:indole-3-glycerol phosphate synthase|uniref:Indole-3-glycerol phosphate synthase n=1 Tax=Brasilonema octagenarum UFV-OR1 TaxID=417115 RepID=A0ABX1MA91_9CYAN|nr:indole-3-glycerol phosphate synthase TrpC [Brasilonema octagenarum]MBW4627928.1 indole-3-glycerol phosphate synthase TrpC [Brasilonema octagenarum HA4186-MV1]NMF62877.1 indole-3-glycerol phosphate synthase TrpC [Brasilonema octagenarum UFV-OR1]